MKQQYDYLYKNNTDLAFNPDSFYSFIFNLPRAGVVKSMDIKTARRLFPDITNNLDDTELQKYCDLSEFLSDMFVNSMKESIKNGGIAKYDKQGLS